MNFDNLELEAGYSKILLPKDFNISIHKLISIIKKGLTGEFEKEDYSLDQFGQEFLEKALKTDFIKGISSDPHDLKFREQKYGKNSSTKESENFCSFFFENLCSFSSLVFIGCSVLTIGVEFGISDGIQRNSDLVCAFLILLIAVISPVVIYFNESNNKKQFATLNARNIIVKNIQVIRNNEIVTISEFDVLTGDIVILMEGMEIPADGLIIEGDNIFVDERALTEEIEPILKTNLKKCRGNSEITSNIIASPIIYSGTKVFSGEGKFLVLVVGADSRIINKMRSTFMRKEETILQKKIGFLKSRVWGSNLILSILILLVLIIRFMVERIQQNNFLKENLKELAHYFLIACSVIQFSNPEYSLVFLLALAFSVKKMLYDNILVKTLKSCEELTYIDTICTDKTGVLTENRLSLYNFWNEKEIIMNTYGKSSLEEIFPNKNIQKLFLQATIVNSSATLRPNKEGSSTELAFLRFIEEICGLNYQTIQNQYSIVRTFPFSSQRKRMSCILTEKTICSEKETILFVKGAPEIILESCYKFHSLTDKVVDMTSELKQEIKNNIDIMNSLALRTIVLAYKNLDGSENLNEKNEKNVYTIENQNLTFFGFVGVKDLIKREVPRAVEMSKNAGIEVKMITGDNKMTAIAIAKECGIMDQKNYSDEAAIEGHIFTKMMQGLNNLERADKIYKNIKVLSRSRPEDKYNMVVELQKANHIVAVIGDGTNDAPALKKANLGIAMGIAGTQEAQDASDIILLDDNFTSFTKGIMWGRNIYDTIQKYLQFNLTMNYVVLGIMLLTCAIIKQEVFKPIQIFWLKLIMDVIASVAMSTELPNLKILTRKPNNQNENIISKKMLKHIIGQAIYEFVILLIIIFYGEFMIPEYLDTLDSQILKDNNSQNMKYNIVDNKYYVRSGRYQDNFQYIENIYGPSRHFTFIFNAFFWMQFFNLLACRKINDECNILEGIKRNKIFIIILITTVLLQGILISHGSSAFYFYQWYDDSTASAGLTIAQWGMCIGFGFGSIVVNFLLNLFPEAKCFKY